MSRLVGAWVSTMLFELGKTVRYISQTHELFDRSSGGHDRRWSRSTMTGINCLEAVGFTFLFEALRI